MTAIVVGDDGRGDRPGATASSCDTCATAVWVAAEHGHVLEHDHRVLCIRCAAAQVAASAALPTLAITPETARALAKRRRRYAHRHGLRLEDVVAWPPVELQLAAEAQTRRN